MVVDTVWGLTVKKNELLSTLNNNLDLPEEIVASFLSQIDMYNLEIELIKDL